MSAPQKQKKMLKRLHSAQDSHFSTEKYDNFMTILCFTADIEGDRIRTALVERGKQALGLLIKKEICQ